MAKKQLSPEKKALLKELQAEREKLKALIAKRKRESKEANKKILEYEKANSMLYFGHADKQYLGRNGKWKPNPPQQDLLLALPDPRKNTFLYTGGNRSGKGLVHGEKVLTPEGWVRIEELKESDYVVSVTGKPVKVIGVAPQGLKPCYKLTFMDDSELKVSGDHLFTVLDTEARFRKTSSRYGKWDVRDVESLYQQYGPEPKPKRRWCVPSNEPVEFESKDTLLAPYVMGIMIGDGTLKTSIMVSTEDKEVLESINACGYKTRFIKGCTYKVYKIHQIFKHYNLRHNSENKFVPKEYLYNDVETRHAILQGLMDSDGYTDGLHTEFSTTSRQLAEDVKFLVQSLSGQAKIRSRMGRYKDKHGVVKETMVNYRVHIKNLYLNPFWIKRKADKYRLQVRTKNKIIKSVEPIGMKDNTCIFVECSTGLFIAQDFIVTHNTFLLAVVACTWLCGRFPWEPKEKGHWLWDLYKWEPPIKLRFVGQGWESHIKTVLVPKMKEMFPNSWQWDYRKNQNGVEAYWWSPLLGGSQQTPNIQIVSGTSAHDTMSLEGWEGHGCLYDEPPPKQVRDACIRGLTDYNGKEYFSCTLIAQPWITTEIVERVDERGFPDPAVHHVHARMWDNEGYGLSREGIERTVEKYKSDPEQLAMRVEGTSVAKLGAVIPEFDRNKHVIDRFEIPSDWMIDLHIDIGWRKPNDIIYLATAPNGFKYVCFEETVKGDGTRIGDSIVKKANRYNLRMNRQLCDPLAKSDGNNENTTWEKIDNMLYKYDMMLEAGTKYKDDGVLAIKNALKTINGQAGLFFFRDCVKTIRQVSNWMYENDKPSKKDDDMCEGLYRLMLLGTEYEDPENNSYEEYESQNGMQSY